MAGRRDQCLPEEKTAADDSAAKLFMDEQTNQMTNTRVISQQEAELAPLQVG